VDLLLELRLPSREPEADAGADGEGEDVVVEVDAEDSIASLVDALAAYSEARGWGPVPRDAARLFRAGAVHPLEPAARIVDTSLLTGDTVTLAVEPLDAWPPPHSPPPGAGSGLSLDVLAGPEAGRLVGLGPGRFTVGRAASCTVGVDDPTLSREHFMLYVTTELQAFVVPNPTATNRTFVGSNEVTAPRALDPGEVIMAGSSAFVARRDAPGDRRRPDRVGQVSVDRSASRRQPRRPRAAPDLAELARRARYLLPRLWERSRPVGNFLELRLGLGDVEARAGALGHEPQIERDVPVTVNLVDVGMLGLWGDAATVGAVGASLVAQAACLHSPEDLLIVAAVRAADVPAFEWLKWLPHVRSSSRSLAGEPLAVGADATRTLLENLMAVAQDRSTRAGRAAHPWPRMVLLLQEAVEPDRDLLSQLLNVAPGAGIHPIWLGEREIQTPHQCLATVACPAGGELGVLRHTEGRRGDQPVALDGARPATAMSIGRSLAPLRDATATAGASGIPGLVPLLDVLGMNEPSADEITRRWGAASGPGLEFPIGMAVGGPLLLDLVEHGPHSLVGGASGAGLSELLRALVLSLAATHPPDRLALMFLDCEGGVDIAEFRDLPHTVGHVTAPGAGPSAAALASLHAELQRRTDVMKGRDLAEMLPVAPAEAPPRLVVVVDDLAALVDEAPDAVAGLADVAQRGPSLGVHLVLAARRSAGLAEGNLLPGTNIRIALRLPDRSDSSRLIGSHAATTIPAPSRGRAYARTGSDAPVAFGCGWPGAPFAPGRGQRRIRVRRFGFGDWLPVGEVDAPATGDERSACADVVATHLDVLVQACAAAGKLNAAARPRPRGQATSLAADQFSASRPGRGDARM
jgi:S-DNA-T family DNA segregation ATPase FtsK/SpoIIIE